MAMFRALLMLALVSSSVAFQTSVLFAGRAVKASPAVHRSFTSLPHKSARQSAERIGLRMQLGEMPGEKAESETPEMTEEMMMLIALQQREQTALPEGSKVVVFGALDRLGQLVVRRMTTDGRYTPAIQTSKGYEQMMRPMDGVGAGFPAEAQVAIEEIPADVSAAILCLEKESDVETLKAVLSLGLPLKKFVLLSKMGVDSRDSDWKLKLNPFLKLEQWAALEEVVKETADLSDFDYTIVRVGTLTGGPFYDSNRDFAGALEDRIYDGEAVGCMLKAGDQDAGSQVTRDVVAQLLVECLARPDAANKVMSIRSVKQKAEGAVPCDEENALQLPPAGKNRPRVVYTPSREQWGKAFAAAFP